MAVTQIPGVQQFIGSLVEDLARRRSLLVLLPTGSEATEIWSRVWTELRRREFSVREVFVPDLPQDSTPVSVLSDVLHVDWGSPNVPRTVANLAETKSNLDIVQLTGVQQLSAARLRDWLMLLVQWAQASQSTTSHRRNRMALCIFVPATAVLTQMPESNVYLGIHWCWGLLSTLEMRLLCRLGDQSEAWSAETRWREHLLPALSGNDISLAEYLWNDLQRDTDDLLARLCAFAEERGWAPDELRAWGAERLRVATRQNSSQRLFSPSSELRFLWAHGALCWTVEYGLELHSAALAMLGWTEELQHRVWRGQSDLLLPLIDHTRLMICEHLTQSYPRDWPVRWYEPDAPEENVAVRDSPLACQWGYLEWLLRNCRDLRSESHLLPLISRAHSIRNKLAHYRPVTFRDYEELWWEIQRFER